MKRSIATLVLLAFVLAGAVPCSAAAMSCGMRMPTSAKSCGSCADDSAAGPVLKAVSCCRTLPGQDRATAPAVLSSLGSGSPAPGKAMSAAIPAAAPSALDAVGFPAPLPSTAAGSPPSSSHSTVLRL